MQQYNTTTVKWLIVVMTTIIIIVSTVYEGRVTPVAASISNPVIITVQPGMSANEIGNLLYERGLIQSVMVFHLAAKMHNLENSLQAGEYAFTREMSVQQIVARLAKGETAYRQITIPEGYSVEQIARLVEEKNLGSSEKFKAAARDYTPYAYMATANTGVTYKSEGYIFPDTYRIARGTTEEQLLSMMVSQFDEQFTPVMRARVKELGLSIREVVILASLVEKEAQLAQDRPLIAGAFFNRIRQDMPLQSCATIQYILGYPKAELSIEDTMIASPYNTYQNKGLPPGPIANPGKAAIQAVLYPAVTDYLYFVADKQGAHHFSRTYEEHLAAIEQVRK
ncbi:MAG: endolytic transglycosylase MltG [Veillonellales bacterium]